MFVESSTPFKLCYYKKNVVGNASRPHLMMSFTCVHYPHVVMVGSLFGGRLVLSKKDSEGAFHIEDKRFLSESKDMSLHNFVENFKGSDGIDFIVVRNPLFFLLTRQQNRAIKVFMTNVRDYVGMFANPGIFFKDNGSEIYNCTKEFVPGIMNDPEVIRDGCAYGSQDPEGPGDVNPEGPVSESNGMIDSEARDSVFVVDVCEHVSDQEFETFLKENGITSTILLGKNEGGVTKFYRYPLLDSSNDALREIAEQFSSCSFDFVEILGRTKIAGTFAGKEVVWYAEVSCDGKNEGSYIECLNDVFGRFASESLEIEE